MFNQSFIIAVLLLSMFSACSPAQAAPPEKKFRLTSLVFRNNALIPPEYTCEGRNINPPLTFSFIPEKTKSIAIIMEDPDAVSGVWVHWIIYNLPPKRIVPANNNKGKLGKTDSSLKGLYSGPCPPSGVHRYHFKAYALDSMLDFKLPPTKEALELAMQKHILARTELVGLYKKTSQ